LSKETRKVAEIGDLVDTEAEKWVHIDLIDKEVRIKKILLGSMGKISQQAGEDPFENLILMLLQGLIEPKLTREQIENMEPLKANEIGMAIADFSGMTKEAAKGVRNLSEATTVSPSG